MKKTLIIVALVAVGFAASAQSLNVSSAYEAQNRGYLKKAKGYIDQAAVHEQTKADPACWFYRTLIYCKIGEAIDPSTKPAHKERAALTQMVPDWYRTAFESVLAWQQFDKEGEYKAKITPFFGVIGNAYLDMALKAMQVERNYQKCIGLCDTSIMMFNMYGKDDYTNQAYYIAGLAAANSQQLDLVKKYFLYLQGKGFNKSGAQQVYETLFSVHNASHDTIAAMKTAKAYVKNCPNDYHANALLATAYALNGNMDKSIETMNQALAKVATNDTLTAEILCKLANLYELNKDYATAEQKYAESLQRLQNQFQANYGLGIMNYNRAVDKLTAANDVPPEDETGLYDQLKEQANEFFRASIPYFQGAVNYIDNMSDEMKSHNRKNLYDCLDALRKVYSRLNMNEENAKISARINELTATK